MNDEAHEEPINEPIKLISPDERVKRKLWIVRGNVDFR